ncbi:nitrate ABC transporter permease [Mesorhizobium sp. L-8-10]|uniref:ABC transporter permease n=1 Tax=Mesorhizobium sp. L-8-10 TaxID=2744523 RepID=UPI0019252F91|nr:ABC transporter permease [Mesorhizobium sp. L-8-10]BCH28339.1 nitrate ABC transporter permease [Mesorhizobium sp. L-8-10]
MSMERSVGTTGPSMPWLWHILPGPEVTRTLGMAVLGLLLALTVWQLVVTLFGVPSYLVPAPTDVAGALVQDRALLLAAAGPTILEAFLGFLLGNTVALLVAVSFVYNKVVEEMFYPVAILVKTIPVVAIAPVLKIILGNGIEPKIVIAALICFFPTLVNSVRGFRAVNPQLLELMHVLSASRTEVFLRIRIYSALPYVFSALKISVTMCVLGAIVGEWIGANQGIGYLLLQSMFDFNAPRLFATILTASIIAIAGFAIVSMLEKWIIRWDPGVAM